MAKRKRDIDSVSKIPERRVLSIPLVPDRERAIAHELGDLLTEMGEDLLELAGIRKDHRERQDKRQVKIDLLVKAVHEGSEEREIECVVEYHFDTNLVRVRRVDTGKQVECRAMTGDEREKQSQLTIQDAAGITDHPSEVLHDLCKTCRHPWSDAKNPHQEADGHSRKSGRCFFINRDSNEPCDCGAFMPIVPQGVTVEEVPGADHTD
jgi:hypothetical protein